MPVRLLFPLRFKILFALLIGITVVVSVITFTMANLFHADKTTYIRDLISSSAVHSAGETESLLQKYVDRSHLFARVAYDSRLTADEKNGMLSDLFRDFPEIVALSFHEDGADPITIFDAQALKKAGLDQSDLDTYREGHPLQEDRLGTGDVVVLNSTFHETLPLLTVATRFTVPASEKSIVIESMVRLDEIVALLARSRLFESFLLDQDGLLLAHEDPRHLTGNRRWEWVPDREALPAMPGLAATFQYVSGGEPMIGGFNRLETGNLLLGVQIPEKAAYLSARELFNHLLWVSLGILLSAAIGGLIWSHRLTRPLARLSSATQEVAKGRFDIQVKPTSRDEIGNLALSFNRMASELHDREKALEDAQTALIQSEKMSAFGQLSAGIAHEVKNPLAGILGYAQLSIKKLDEDSVLLKNLRTIEKETRRCNDIIENLMKFARQEQAEFSSTDVNRVVVDAVGIVAHQLGVNQVTVEQDLSDQLSTVRGNANQLQQVLMNILINAQQAMEGLPGTVRVSTRSTDDGSLEIRVSDTGPGLAEDIRERIFEPFFTTKPAGKGTGLGLSVSYGIIRDHGGTIIAESRAGEGCTFLITLPVESPDTAGE